MKQEGHPLTHSNGHRRIRDPNARIKSRYNPKNRKPNEQHYPTQYASHGHPNNGLYRRVDPQNFHGDPQQLPVERQMLHHGGHSSGRFGYPNQSMGHLEGDASFGAPPRRHMNTANFPGQYHDENQIHHVTPASWQGYDQHASMRMPQYSGFGSGVANYSGSFSRQLPAVPASSRPPTHFEANNSGISAGFRSDPIHDGGRSSYYNHTGRQGSLETHRASQTFDDYEVLGGRPDPSAGNVATDLRRRFLSNSQSKPLFLSSSRVDGRLKGTEGIADHFERRPVDHFPDEQIAADPFLFDEPLPQSSGHRLQQNAQRFSQHQQASQHQYLPSAARPKNRPPFLASHPNKVEAVGQHKTFNEHIDSLADEPAMDDPLFDPLDDSVELKQPNGNTQITQSASVVPSKGIARFKKRPTVAQTTKPPGPTHDQDQQVHGRQSLKPADNRSQQNELHQDSCKKKDALKNDVVHEFKAWKDDDPKIRFFNEKVEVDVDNNPISKPEPLQIDDELNLLGKKSFWE